ncbi:hypothetical protein ACJIZ3_009137 [Penstemon smallii]|uniref:PB1 domain-containing protein n=1 Tax=Penstemon smallii TaxID=265156 RepID=A0ABD3TCR3_9LAMI
MPYRILNFFRKRVAESESCRVRVAESVSVQRRYSRSEFMENAEIEEYMAELLEKHELFGTVFWKNLPPESSVVEREIRKKIILGLREILTLNSNACYLIQFWAHKVFDGRSHITNLDQPFVVGGKKWLPAIKLLGLYLKHKPSLKHRYYVGGEEESVREEEIGPPGRVFKYGHPESSPDLCLYSTKDYPLRNNAAFCRLKAYMALPVFDVLDQRCLGVLEYLTFDVGFKGYEIPSLYKGLEKANLRSTHTTINVPIHNNFDQEAAARDMEELIRAVMRRPQVVGVQVCCMKLKTSIFRELPPDFMQASNFHGVQMGKGVAGTALKSQNKMCFCKSLCHFNIIDYPLAHFAQQARLNVSFAICLQSSHTGNEIYVIEFFLKHISRKNGYHRLMHILVQMLKLLNFKVSYGKLGDDIDVTVINFCQVQVTSDSAGKKLEVSENLSVNKSTSKRGFIDCGINSGPSSKKNKKNSAANFELATPTVPLDKSVISQNLTKEPKTTDVLMMKARFKDKIVKFKLSISSGLDKLMEEVARRLNLVIGCFELQYQDEDGDWIVLACDEDLLLFKETSAVSSGKALYIRVLVL